VRERGGGPVMRMCYRDFISRGSDASFVKNYTLRLAMSGLGLLSCLNGQARVVRNGVLQ